MMQKKAWEQQESSAEPWEVRPEDKSSFVFAGLLWTDKGMVLPLL